MCDHDNRQLLTRLCDLINCFLDFNLALWVEGRRGFVKDQDLGSLDQSSCDRDALLLATRHVDNAGSAHKRVHALLLLKDEVGVSAFQGLAAVSLRGILVTIEKVVSDGAHDHDGLLGDVANLFAQVSQIHVANIFVVEADRALIWVVETLNELDNCRLSRA